MERKLNVRAEDFEDEKEEVKIKKEDRGRLNVHIASYNNFPTAAGLASSAAGFACLVYSLAKLMNVKDDFGPLSAIARKTSLVERWNRSEGTPQAACTFDAGPNAVLIAPNRKLASLLLQRPPDAELNRAVC
ncbi:uncharacterized protein A4U43_C10F17170 [Asparagus officinalis]|uniref:Diphosphomevalonate decarboxylase-like N-terminal domain-containing protein n=1 Tax=Asparagus officinalis TaxID=4686 RepID=A0A5P1E6S4_ASPOF|nr:uncharacterized protein A4U43_C10F17170 [Asparagus officinalis]